MDSYYSKYLKYKQKYLNLKKMIGGGKKLFDKKHFKENFKYEDLLNFIKEFATSAYYIEKTNYEVIDKTKDFNFYKDKLIVIGVPHIETNAEACRYLYLGKMDLDPEKFKLLWKTIGNDGQPTLRLEDYICLYDTERKSSESADLNFYSQKQNGKTIHWNHNIIIFGFIDEKLIDEKLIDFNKIITEAKKIRNDIK